MKGYEFISFSRKGPHHRNEDYKFVGYHDGVMIVADGITNARAGGQAAYCAVSTLAPQLSFLARKMRQTNFSQEDIENKMKKCVLWTNTIMTVLSNGIEPYNGWGTTLDSATIQGNTAYCCHVGDGVVMHHSTKQGLVKLSTSHADITDTIGGIDLGPLTQYMGKENVQVDYFTVPIERGDTLVLATDGLLKVISKKKLEEAIIKYKSPAKLKNHLLQLIRQPSEYASEWARRNGITVEQAAHIVRDDITAVFVRRTG